MRFAKNVLSNMRELKSDTMSVHSSRPKYFASLRRDPYGFNNKTYNWKGEDQFVLVSALFYIVGFFSILLLEYKQIVAPIDNLIYLAFSMSIVIEIVGKLFFSFCIQQYKIKINYIRKLAIRPWRKLKIYVITLFFMVDGKNAVHIITLLFCLDQMKTILTEWNVVRRKIPFLAYAFVAWDRLEDRPYTLRYDMLEDILRFAVYLPFIIVFGKASVIIMIPNLINEFGDGLAEPVGLRFGRHKYRAKSLWYQGKFWHGEFQRSLEGSAMVFLVSILVLFMYEHLFTVSQFVFAIAILPLLMTLAEAFSPHTNDGPMLALTGCGFLWFTINYI